MIVLPAIDLRGGKCVRLVNGDFSKETVYSEQPEEMARKWQEQGAEYLHIVDLDGARSGNPQNIFVIKRIIEAVDIPIELGGGIRTMESIENMLDMGVERVILGSVAVKDPELVREACLEFDNRIAVGIDAKDGIVAVEGWGVSGDMDAVELAMRMGDVGVQTIIYTDISRDGTLDGVNVDATADLARSTGVSIIASGGVGSLSDIEALKQRETDGIAGVILGKALYSGAIELPKAIEIAGRMG
ncbi:MAG TPA: 1-(5-phosphoribosyl)-5-((5-phosphoribosylamino)methylideneamino)imidazole-4-carboxamide isomerase [Selenomonas sp.]|nr:1-(5-phosphoribosyl)-5-[(5-phosphoribosylamino)methylideneamino]imidazole-4-carboxamide isomerase [Selenomonadaceae bacterium]HCB92704.1 1-(5-phosphoribosyl)-5-((5-phosphoribosylamino)methylideneamino)imidazole-4-carboxamide isomerase [Selenomonas sp.]